MGLLQLLPCGGLLGELPEPVAGIVTSTGGLVGGRGGGHQGGAGRGDLDVMLGWDCGKRGHCRVERVGDAALLALGLLKSGGFVFDRGQPSRRRRQPVDHPVTVGQDLGDQGWVDHGQPDLRLLPGGCGPQPSPIGLVRQLLQASSGVGQGGSGPRDGVGSVDGDAPQMRELFVAKLLEFG